MKTFLSQNKKRFHVKAQWSHTLPFSDSVPLFCSDPLRESQLVGETSFSSSQILKRLVLEFSDFLV